MNNLKRLTANYQAQAKALMLKINDNPDLWDQIKLRQTTNGSPHSDTKTIFVRGPGTFTIEGYMQETTSIDYQAMQTLGSDLHDLILPILKNHIKPKELGRILIVKLKPGGAITPHIDEGVYADYFQRFHFCLQTNEKSHLKSGDDIATPKQGELWWFNHKDTHTAFNDGDTDRIHIIIDALPVKH